MSTDDSPPAATGETGAEALLRSFLAQGVDTCFANPGTSEMHFVSALDRAPGMRCVLGLFEGVVTGAADGYARMTGQPAATLLHLGPGLANGLSNLHNARRARSPVVNVIGDHATTHRQLDAPLTSDIEGAARPFSDWVRTSPDADSLATDAAAAVAAARSGAGRIASLVLPADAAWGSVSARGASAAAVPAAPQPSMLPSTAQVEATVAALRAGDGPVMLLIDGAATRDGAVETAGRIAAATGADVFTPTQCARLTRGAGRAAVERLPYPAEQARAVLARYATLVLVGAKPPVSFFAYPGREGRLVAPGTRVVTLCGPEGDAAGALDALCGALGAEKTAPRVAEAALPPAPSGALSPETLGPMLARHLPEGAIVIDESITTGRGFLDATAGAAPHDWIFGTGGSIGYGLPCAVGAAVACPDRKVICLESDGSGMYMPQALWTMARETLPVLTLIFANRRYQILRSEMANVGAQIGPKAASLLDIDRPTLDWVGLARAQGVQATRVEDLAALDRAMVEGVKSDAPCLIEVVL